jgi:hypothetical protein
MIGEDDDLRLWPALVQDVSSDGLGLIVARPIDVGSHLAVRWMHTDQGNTIFQEIDVKHVQPFGNSAWIVGGTFPES